MKTSKQGKQAEQACCEYLENQGLKLLTTNYHCRCGEIDLVMQHHSSLVFVEVRYRSSSRFGGALESIDYRKRQKLMNTARHYQQKHNIQCPVRIDVVAMSPGNNNAYQFEWLQDAIRES